MKLVRIVPCLTLSALPLSAASAQNNGVPVFSIDYKGPTISLPDSFTGTPITEGDLLAPQLLMGALGPLATPGTVESGGSLSPVGLGLNFHLGCVGHPANTPCLVEVDAISHGLDEVVGCTSNPGTPPPRWAFSVDYRALGDPSSPNPPDVYTEALCAEEGADVYIDLGLPCGPLPPGPSTGNTVYLDGNGMPDCTGAYWTPGVGLIENPSTPGPWDNLDALDDDNPDRWLPSTTCSYFSLDSSFLDPQLSINNTGSAAAHGFRPGDVLMSCQGCAPAVYASAIALGLDAGGAGTDDLDALALRENGIPGYQRSTTPYDWLSGASDMLFFSVRRGSTIIGTPDAFFGVPIEQGDILVPTGAFGSTPGIWIAAENLGLATTRSIPGVIGDDLDALDVLRQRPPGTSFCLGDGSGTPCPCLNNGAAGRGCGNSSNGLGAVLWASGTPSISFDSVRFSVSGMPNTATALLYQGTTPLVGIPFGDGLRCVGGNQIRLYIRLALCGNREFGYGVPGDLPLSVRGSITTPQTRYYQVWYRDPSLTFCSAPATFNLTNAYTITWVP